MLQEQLYGCSIDGRYRHHPSFLRLFRRQYDQLLENEAFKEACHQRYKCFAPPAANEALQKIETEKTNAEGDAAASLSYAHSRLIRQIGDEHVEFWRWLEEQLLRCAFILNFSDESFISSDVMQTADQEQETLLNMLTKLPSTEVSNFKRFFEPSTAPILDRVVDVLRVEELMEALHLTSVQAYETLIDDHVRPLYEATSMLHVNFNHCIELVVYRA